MSRQLDRARDCARLYQSVYVGIQCSAPQFLAVYCRDTILMFTFQLGFEQTLMSESQKKRTRAPFLRAISQLNCYVANASKINFSFTMHSWSDHDSSRWRIRMQSLQHPISPWNFFSFSRIENVINRTEWPRSKMRILWTFGCGLPLRFHIPPLSRATSE